MSKTIDPKQVRHDGIMNMVWLWWFVIMAAMTAFWIGVGLAIKLFIDLLK